MVTWTGLFCPLIPPVLAVIARILRGPEPALHRTGTNRYGNATCNVVCDPWYRDLGFGLCPDDFVLLCIWSILAVAVVQILFHGE